MKNRKTELWKALHNPMFYAALAIGTMIAMVNVVENAGIVNQLSQSLENKIARGGYSKNPMGFSLFIHWIAVACSSFGNQVFYFVWPILAAMPFGWSYSQERRNGEYYQIVSRSSAKSYFASKYIAVFVSGGLAVAVPVLLNLLVNAMICPYVVPQAVVPISLVSDGYFLSELYYTIPWVYALIWCGMEFLIGGAAACVCLVVGAKFRLQVMVVLTPFALFVLLDGVLYALNSVIKQPVNFSPLKLAAAAGNLQNPEWSVFMLLGIMIMAGILGGYWQVVKHELG